MNESFFLRIGALFPDPWLNAAAWLAVGTALSAVGMPRLWITGGLALVMRPLPAFVVSLAATLLGNYAPFLLCRLGKAKRWIDRIRNHPRFPAGLADGVGLAETVFARQLPVPSIVTTIALALTDVPARTFLLGSLLGYLPSAAFVVVGVATARDVRSSGWLAVAALAMAALAAAGIFVRRRYGRRTTDRK